MKKSLTISGIIAGVFLILAILFYFLCLNHITVNECGVAYNSLNGKLWVQTNAGWYVTSPFVKVARVNLLPVKVHIPSEAKVINTKYVKMNPDYVLDYVKLQGFSYSMGGLNLEGILMGYAFSGQKFTFLDVVQEGGTENAPRATP